MSPENVLEILNVWVERGWLRLLDRAFAAFLQAEQPKASNLLLLAAALTSYQLGRGHICLDLQAALNDPDAILSLPTEAETDENLPDRPSELLSGISRQIWEQSLLDSALVTAGAGNTPLVLNDGLLYLRRYWQYTQDAAQSIRQRLHRRFPVPDNLSLRLDDLFTSLRTPQEQIKAEIHWQSVAAAIAVRSAFTVISGGPGTGKTTTVVHVLGLLQGLALEQGHKLRIRLAAPTGKAAARLTESIGHAIEQLPETIRDHIPSEVTTLHRLLGSRPDTRHFFHCSRNRLHVDLLVVDEASMIDLEMMAALLDALPADARLILLGDKDQLASVEAGSVLGDLCRNAERPGYHSKTAAWIEKYTGYSLQGFTGNGSRLDQHIAVLRKSHRFGEKSGIGAMARRVNRGNTDGVAALWHQGFDDIARLSLQTPDDPRFARLVLDGYPQSASSAETSQNSAGYRVYLERVKAGPEAFASQTDWLQAVLDAFGRFQLLAALRRGIWGVERLNVKAAEILYRAGLIEAGSGWYSGRPVMITRNDYSLGLMNGDIGIALSVMPEQEGSSQGLRVVFPLADGSMKMVLPSRLNDVETVYAMTVHKSQGSEFDHTAMILPDSLNPVLSRELIYTGITRARRWFTLVTPHAGILTESIQRRTHRASGFGELLR